MKVPFYRPYRLPKPDLTDLKSEIGDILSSGIITNNAKCRELEEWFMRNYHTDYAVAFSSCSQALYACIRAIHPKSIQMPAFTWKTYEHILDRKQIKSFFDIDRETWLPVFGDLTADLIITNATFGNYDNPPAVAPHQKVLCDHAFSVGLEFEDVGTVSVFSTTATKTVTSCEGGIAVTNDPSLAMELSEIRNKISRMSEVHATIGLKYLNHLDEILGKKKRIFDYYKEHLPFEFQKPAKRFNYGYCGVLFETREKKESFMESVKDGMEVQSKYEPLWGARLENTQFVFDRIVLLPAYPDLDPWDVVDVIEEEWLNRKLCEKWAGKK